MRSQTVQQVDVKKLQQLLLQNPLMDGSTPEVLADNDDATSVTITGNWKKTNQWWLWSFMVACSAL
jgi:hypothetical protein